jgi:penicillin-insensitive murein endopeptidase
MSEGRRYGAGAGRQATFLARAPRLAKLCLVRRAVMSGLALFFAAGCFGLRPMPPGTVSWGHTSNGVLVDGVAIDDEGAGFVRARPGEDTRWGTPRLVHTLERAAAEVALRYPGAAPLRVGDLAARGGGRHSRHASHRTGRDVDVIFYATDVAGRSVRGRGWLAYDRFGLSRETISIDGEPPSDRLYFFDAARNWTFVRALLTDPDAPVQWIFCSRGVKARLLAWAAEHETDPALLVRARWVLHQPTRGRPHDDHFHVRIACSADERASGCRDHGPVWPWTRRAIEKSGPFDAAAPLTDEALVAALLDDPPPPRDVVAVAAP